jgi:anti-sigma regulatory factor (Ser/Thr protein kinase)
VPEAVAARVWCVVVPHRPEGARLARHRLSAALADRLPATVLSDVVAVAAELIGNAVRHAAPLPGDVVRVAWRLSRVGVFEIRVTDGGAAGRPTERIAGPEAPDGRGLTIVSALADTWGVVRDGLGQCVWAQVKVPTARRPEPALAGAPA